MSNSIACVCGYRGPSVTEGSRGVCPICRTPAANAFTPPVAPSPAAAAPKAAPKPEREPTQAKGSLHFRIPCPRGHVLKAPATMLGQQVFCPQCNEVFVLRETDSLEHKRHQRMLDSELEAQQAKVWLQRAIMAAVFVVLSFAVMVAIQFMR